jgi:peroxiredoxin/outer membrane lipoprotein-sorting protein
LTNADCGFGDDRIADFLFAICDLRSKDGVGQDWTHSMKKTLSLSLVVGLGLMGAGLLGAAPPLPPVGVVTPATRPADEVKTSAKVSDDARTLLDAVDGAYAKLKALDVSGTVSVKIKIEGEADESHSTSFTGSYLAPNKFRHEAKDDVLMGATGSKMYTFRADKNAYTQADEPKDRVTSNDWPKEIAEVLGSQNPSIMLALCKSASGELLDEVAAADKAEDTHIGDASCPTLKLKLNDDSTMLAIFDPESHLLWQTRTDVTAPLKKRRADLNSAVVTTEYSRVKMDEELKDGTFAWTPPVGAADADAAAAPLAADGIAAASLKGKAAPAFKLPGVDGKEVSIASLKGQVVVIDFWATWCGPCKLSLPHLDKMYQAEKANGVQIFAIDEQEDLKDVTDFIKETKLGVPVLMDRDAKVGEAYGVEGIPQTVVIGKDGKVREVFVGFSEKMPEMLAKAVEEAKKG